MKITQKRKALSCLKTSQLGWHPFIKNTSYAKHSKEQQIKLNNNQKFTKRLTNIEEKYNTNGKGNKQRP